MRRAHVVAWSSLLLAACEVPDPPPSTGGTDDDAHDCAGVMVVSSDYQSTSVAFLGWDGAVISPHVLSSGSTESALSAPLSGDVVAPTVATEGGEVVLVDRYPASVLTWVSERTGAVSRQLSVRTGFVANAQDFVAVSAEKGFVSRLEANPDPGREPFDAGSDVLIVDPSLPAIVGRIGFEAVLSAEEVDLTPAPSRLALAGDRLVVLLSVYSTDFRRTGDARVALVDVESHAIVAAHRVEGLRGCSGLALSADGARAAVACSGTFAGDDRPTLDDAGVAVVDLASGEIQARTGGITLGAPPAFSIAFASNEALLLPTFGHTADGQDPAAGDALHWVPLDGTPPSILLRTTEPFTLGEVRCDLACGACLVADAGRGAVHRFVPAPTGDGMAEAGAISIEDGIGLPPRYLGSL